MKKGPGTIWPGQSGEGVVLDVSGELPKSFVVCDHPYHAQIVYLSQLNTSTLKNRAESEKPVL